MWRSLAAVEENCIPSKPLPSWGADLLGKSHVARCVPFGRVARTGPARHPIVLADKLTRAASPLSNIGDDKCGIGGGKSTVHWPKRREASEALMAQDAESKYLSGQSIVAVEEEEEEEGFLTHTQSSPIQELSSSPRTRPDLSQHDLPVSHHVRKDDPRMNICRDFQGLKMLLAHMRSEVACYATEDKTTKPGKEHPPEANNLHMSMSSEPLTSQPIQGKTKGLTFTSPRSRVIPFKPPPPIVISQPRADDDPDSEDEPVKKDTNSAVEDWGGDSSDEDQFEDENIGTQGNIQRLIEKLELSHRFGAIEAVVAELGHETAEYESRNMDDMLANLSTQQDMYHNMVEQIQHMSQQHEVHFYRSLSLFFQMIKTARNHVGCKTISAGHSGTVPTRTQDEVKRLKALKTRVLGVEVDIDSPHSSDSGDSNLGASVQDEEKEEASDQNADDLLSTQHVKAAEMLELLAFCQDDVESIRPRVHREEQKLSLCTFARNQILEMQHTQKLPVDDNVLIALAEVGRVLQKRKYCKVGVEMDYARNACRWEETINYNIMMKGTLNDIARFEETATQREEEEASMRSPFNAEALSNRLHKICCPTHDPSSSRPTAQQVSIRSSEVVNASQRNRASSNLSDAGNPPERRQSGLGRFVPRLESQRKAWQPQEHLEWLQPCPHDLVYALPGTSTSKVYKDKFSSIFKKCKEVDAWLCEINQTQHDTKRKVKDAEGDMERFIGVITNASDDKRIQTLWETIRRKDLSSIHEAQFKFVSDGGEHERTLQALMEEARRLRTQISVLQGQNDAVRKLIEETGGRRSVRINKTPVEAQDETHESPPPSQVASEIVDVKLCLINADPDGSEALASRDESPDVSRKASARSNASSASSHDSIKEPVEPVTEQDSDCSSAWGRVNSVSTQGGYSNLAEVCVTTARSTKSLQMKRVIQSDRKKPDRRITSAPHAQLKGKQKTGRSKSMESTPEDQVVVVRDEELEALQQETERFYTEASSKELEFSILQAQAQEVEKFLWAVEDEPCLNDEMLAELETTTKMIETTILSDVGISSESIVPLPKIFVKGGDAHELAMSELSSSPDFEVHNVLVNGRESLKKNVKKLARGHGHGRGVSQSRGRRQKQIRSDQADHADELRSHGRSAAQRTSRSRQCDSRSTVRSSFRSSGSAGGTSKTS